MRRGDRSFIKLIITILIITIILYLPIHAGYAKIPKDWTPREVANLLEGVVKYWIEVLKVVIAKLQQLIKDFLKK